MSSNILYYCQKCGKPVYEKYGSGKFCCRACANSHIHSTETKLKIHQSVAITRSKTAKHSCLDEKRHCALCGVELSLTNESGYCVHCIRKADELREARVAAGKKGYQTMITNGTFNGWKSRNIKSYAEIFWEKVLNNNNIEFEREVPVKKDNNINNYFLDFKIVSGEKILDLEIDGKQHRYEERAKSDEIRDEYLRSLNYTVYRISWNEINTESGKLAMKKKIDDFLDFYIKFKSC